VKDYKSSVSVIGMQHPEQRVIESTNKSMFGCTRKQTDVPWREMISVTCDQMVKTITFVKQRQLY
jgi:hypothetical protein